MRELLHLILREASLLPTLDPRPGLDVRNAVLALAVAGQVLARLAGVFAGEMDLEHAVDAQGFFLEALDGVGDFLGGRAGEVVDLACVDVSILFLFGEGGLCCVVLYFFYFLSYLGRVLRSRARRRSIEEPGYARARL